MQSSSLSLVLVRNTVSHDARVLREAATLRDLGFTVLVLGVVSTSERQTHLEIAGARVVRLDPAAALRRVIAWTRATDGRSAGKTAHARITATQGVVDVGPREAGRLTAGLRRVSLTVAYYLEGIALVRRTTPALVHANDYNTMWIGIAAKLLCGSRLVYDSHELWPDRNRRPEWRPWLIACETLFVRLADATITTSPGYSSAIAERYHVRPPMVIRNVPARRPGRALGLDRRTGASGPLVVYVGGLMPGRGLEQAIRALSWAPELRLRLIGPGTESYRGALRLCAEEAGVTDRLELAPAVPPTAVVDSIADADLGLMLIEPVCRSYELTLPNKLFEYAAAGLPILSSDLPVIGPLVREEKLGHVVGTDDPEEIAQGMRRLAQPSLNKDLRVHVRAFAERVTWEGERATLERVYTDLVAAEPGPGVAGDRRVARIYGRYAASPRKQRTWSAENPGNVAIRSELVDAVFALAGADLLAAREILDVGCGSGWWLDQLGREHRITAGLHGLELLPERAAGATERAPAAEIAVGDARELPYAERTFDVVTLFTVLSSLPGSDDAERALREALRVLRPRGVLVVWEPRVPNPLNPDTIFISDRLLRRMLGPLAIEFRTTTVLPALARRLGSRTSSLYPRLSRVGALRTHRLAFARTTGPPAVDLAD